MYVQFRFLRKRKKELYKAKNVDEIFDIIEKYWNPTDYSFLEFIVHEFCNCKLQEKKEKY